MIQNHYIATPLPDLAVIEAAGPDAATFLQGQLSNDIASMVAGQARLAAYCTPKGRMLASLVFWQVADAPQPVYRALIKRDIAPAIVKRLSMFVLRAKVKLTLSEMPVVGVVVGTPAASPLAGTGNASTPDTDSALMAGLPEGLGNVVAQLPTNAAPYTTVPTPLGAFIAAPRASGSAMRWWFVADADPALSNTVTPRASGAETSTDAIGETQPISTPTASLSNPSWAADDIAAGLPWVQAAIQEVFIPQTLNFDLIDGVSFTKGCYPGQEVVARSHYRGTVKRRMARGVATVPGADASAWVGQDTFNALAPDAPAGRVVNAAALGDQVHLLLEIQLADIGTADLRLQSPDGPAIQLAELPYTIQPEPA